MDAENQVLSSAGGPYLQSGYGIISLEHQKVHHTINKNAIKMQHKFSSLFLEQEKISHHREIKIKYKSRPQRTLKLSTDYIQHITFINLHYVGFNHT